MSGKRGSNPRPLAWEANALPTELLPQNRFCSCKIRHFYLYAKPSTLLFCLRLRAFAVFRRVTAIGRSLEGQRPCMEGGQQKAQGNSNNDNGTSGIGGVIGHTGRIAKQHALHIEHTAEGIGQKSRYDACRN